MLLQENKYINISGAYPNAILIDATGPGLTDGSELVALNQNDGFEAFQQALMFYMDGGSNFPTGSIGVPNGVSESAGFSQMIQAIMGMSGTGPGKGVILFNKEDPAVTGDRILLLQGQGVLRSIYPDLDAKVYVGDPNNAAAFAGGGSGLSRGAFYHADDAAGTIENPAGIYLILPESRGYAMRVIDALAAIDPQGAIRFLGDNQLDATQKITGTLELSGAGAGAGTGALINGPLGPATRQTGGSSANTIIFDNSASISPNTGKTDDDETRMANISFKLGITY